MCTTIGFSYRDGIVFGRTLEVGVSLDNKILFVPRDKTIIQTVEGDYKTKYRTLGSAFFGYFFFWGRHQ